MAVPDGRYVEIDDAACCMRGYGREELFDRHITDLIEPENVAAMPLSCHLLRGGDTVLHERRFRRSDGSGLQAGVSAFNLPGGGMLALVRDVGLRREAEAALRARGSPSALTRARLSSCRASATNCAPLEAPSWAPGSRYSSMRQRR